MQRPCMPGLGMGCVLGFAVALASGCGSGNAATEDGYIKVITRLSPVSFDPRIGTDKGSQRVHQLVYSDLLAVNDTLQAAPGADALAVRLDHPDPFTYIVHLRAGVRFHDGHELTSKDVVYTFGSFLDPGFVSAKKAAYQMLESVKALDTYIVEFKLKAPFSAFPAQLVMPVVPDGAGDSVRSFPIGTGPYRFVRYIVDEQVELSAYEGYWDGLPQNTGIVLRIVPDDAMRSLELRKGSADLTVNDVPPDAAYQLQKDGLTIQTASGVDYAYVGLNMRDPVLQSKHVRQALAYAIDRKAIVKYLRRGLARTAVGVLSPVVWAFEPDVHEFDYDPERAKRLLDEAGYPDPDGEGPRPRLRLSLKTSTDEFFRPQAAMIREHLRLVGVEVDVRSYESDPFYADVLRGNMQMYTLQWEGVTDPDMLRRVYQSTQIPPAGFNRVYYSSPDVDRLLDLAQKAGSDEERGEHYSAIQKLVAEDAPYISLWHTTNIAVTRPEISGIHLSAQAGFLSLKDVRKRQ